MGNGAIRIRRRMPTLHPLDPDEGYHSGQLDHTVDLENVGTNTHAQLDTHVASSTDPHGANMTLTGNLHIGGEFTFDKALTYVGVNPCYIYGGDTAGDDLNLYANNQDVLGFINIGGGGLIRLSSGTGTAITFMEGGTDFFWARRSNMTYSSNASNATGVLFDVDNITSGIGLEISADDLTTGSALKIDDDGAVLLDVLTDEINMLVGGGSVGIGTATPGTTLEVTGTISVTNAAGGAILNEAAGTLNPTVLPNKADRNTGLGQSALDKITLVCGGNASFTVSFSSASPSNAGGYALLNEATSATNPTLAPHKADTNTGLGRAAEDELSLIAGGVEGMRLLEAGGAVIIDTNSKIASHNGRIVNTDRYTGNQTLDSTNHVVVGDTDGGAFTITLPAGVDGTHYNISNVGRSANALTLAPNGAELLVGANANFDIFDGETLDLHYETTEGWVA